jgi:Tol biopolymer transport system component
MDYYPSSNRGAPSSLNVRVPRSILNCFLLTLGTIAFFGAAPIANYVARGASPALDSDRGGDVTQTLTITEGTNLAVTASPDHQTIVIDLQGVLWSLPISGGTAKQLTDPLLEPARPDWSPRGDLVAFESYAGGTFHIWIMRPDGSGVRQLTFGHGDDREPRFSPDGTKLAFSSDRAFSGSYDIWVVDLATGNLTQLTSSSADEFEPTWSPDGNEVAFVSGTGSTGTTIQALNSQGTIRTVASAPAGAHLNSPSFSPDGSRIAYLQFANNKSQLLVSGVQIGSSNDVFPFYPVWLSADSLLYSADGKIRISNISGLTSEIPFQAQIKLLQPSYAHKKFDFGSGHNRSVKGIVSPALSPDGKHILFEALNQLWLLEIGNRKPEQLTFDGYYKVDPCWAPDGKRIAYSSDCSTGFELASRSAQGSHRHQRRSTLGRSRSGRAL